MLFDVTWLLMFVVKSSNVYASDFLSIQVLPTIDCRQWWWVGPIFLHVSGILGNIVLASPLGVFLLTACPIHQASHGARV